MPDELPNPRRDFGVDLTVRPGGHVEPERVAEDLPRAFASTRWAAPRAASAS